MQTEGTLASALQPIEGRMKCLFLRMEIYVIHYRRTYLGHGNDSQGLAALGEASTPEKRIIDRDYRHVGI
jgi:hypothetical protein